MIKTRKDSRTLVAAREILAEITRIDLAIARHTKEVANLKFRRQRHLQAYQALAETLDGVELHRLDRSPLSYTSAPINASRVSAAAKHLIEKLKSDVERTWKVEEIQKHLSNSGANVSNRYASNTLRKLYEKGHLVKVKRGLYRVNDSLLAIEGLEND